MAHFRVLQPAHVAVGSVGSVCDYIFLGWTQTKRKYFPHSCALGQKLTLVPYTFSVVFFSCFTAAVGSGEVAPLTAVNIQYWGLWWCQDTSYDKALCQYIKLWLRAAFPNAPPHPPTRLTFWHFRANPHINAPGTNEYGWSSKFCYSCAFDTNWNRRKMLLKSCHSHFGICIMQKAII